MEEQGQPWLEAQGPAAGFCAWVPSCHPRSRPSHSLAADGQPRSPCTWGRGLLRAWAPTPSMGNGKSPWAFCTGGDSATPDLHWVLALSVSSVTPRRSDPAGALRAPVSPSSGLSTLCGQVLPVPKQPEFPSLPRCSYSNPGAVGLMGSRKPADGRAGPLIALSRWERSRCSSCFWEEAEAHSPNRGLHCVVFVCFLRFILFI